MDQDGPTRQAQSRNKLPQPGTAVKRHSTRELGWFILCLAASSFAGIGQFILR